MNDVCNGQGDMVEQVVLYGQVEKVVAPEESSTPCIGAACCDNIEVLRVEHEFIHHVRRDSVRDCSELQGFIDEDGQKGVETN